MKIKSLIFTTILLFTSHYSYSDAYKCRDADGKITLQSMKCASGDISSVIKISPYKKKSSPKRVVKKVIKKAPPGRWVGVNSNKLIANIASYGGFEMTDENGATLKGFWQTADNNGYTVKATLQGRKSSVNMKYNAASDALFLSKPGSLSSFEMYKRR